MKSNGRCMYNAIRRGIECPLEYTAIHLKRQLVLFMTVHAEFFYKFCYKTILHSYNSSGKQFSFKDYLLYLLESDSWGDEVVLNTVSFMWNLTITVICAQSLARIPIRHREQDLEKVHLLLLYSGGVHYSAIGTYTGHLRVFRVANIDIRVVGGYYRVVDASYLRFSLISILIGSPSHITGR